jgi:hypothetical protein
VPSASDRTVDLQTARGGSEDVDDFLDHHGQVPFCVIGFRPGRSRRTLEAHLVR